MSDEALKLRYLPGPGDVADALPVALCGVDDTRSRALVERSGTP